MGFWIGYAETPEEREWAERRDYEDYQAQRDAEDVAQKDRRIAELEAALRPFADAWKIASDVAPNATIGQRGAVSKHEVGGVHFRRAFMALTADKPRS